MQKQSLFWVVTFLLVAFSVFSQGINVAPTGIPSQSTTCWNLPAELAIDGDTTNLTATCPEDLEPYWQLELLDSSDITRIVLHNRDSCCASRLRDITVFVLDDIDGDIVFESDLLNPENELGGGVANQGPEFIELDLVELTGDPVEGLIVKVTRIPDPDLSGTGGGGVIPDEETVLTLGEVEVYVEADDIAPVIMQQPQGGRVQVGEPFTFSVEAMGSEPLRYQWRKGDQDIAGATEATLTIESVATEDAGLYMVIVSNDVDDVSSEAVELVVPGRNIAPWGTAYQSSLGHGGLPARAIDGNTSQNWNSGSLTCTSEFPPDPSPWWEVKLAGMSTIESITLWNRTDCCAERLSNFMVTVFDDERDPVFVDEYFVEGIDFVDPMTPFNIELPPDTQGLFVRIELQGPNAMGEQILTLAEVEIFGDGPEPPESGGQNIARAGTASQSSTWNNQFPAELATDGILGNFTATAADDADATWELDLGEVKSLGQIVLYNRTSCCGSRLRDITVFILGEDGEEIVYESDLLNPENEEYTFPGGPATLTVNLIEETGEPVEGRIVRVKRTPDPDLSGTGGQGNVDEANLLSLGEVEIYESIDCPPEGDTHCAGIMYEGPGDGEPGLYWIYAAATDDSGDVPYVTFKADNGEDPPMTFGPSRVFSAPFLLSRGDWTITVSVNDTFLCNQVAADATCTEELELLGDPDNVALNGTATQSTTEGARDASLAIDGITNGVLNNGSISHTALNDVAPWWELDLGQAFPLDSVVLWNRTDASMERLSNFSVVILDEGRDEVFFEEFFTEGLWFVDTMDEGFEIGLPQDTSGRYVRIEMLGFGTSGETILALAEVQVFRGAGGGEGDFQRGDTNGDGKIDLADAISTLDFLFGDGGDLICPDAADSNDDGKIDLADAISTLTYLFSDQDELPPPFGQCGPDPKADDLPQCNYPQEGCP